MIATKSRRESAKKLAKPARPVAEVLLELAYYLNATHVIARPAKAAQGQKSDG